MPAERASGSRDAPDTQMDTRQVQQAMQQSQGHWEQAARQMEQLSNTIRDAAIAVGTAKCTPTQMQRVDTAFAKVLQSRNVNSGIIQALRDLNSSYQPDKTEPTAFQQLFAQSVPNFNAQTCPSFKQYQAAVAQATVAPASESQEDDDIQELNSGVARNAQCPISGTKVLELKDPVVDNLGYVYEKSAIVGYIQQKRTATVACPVAGTSHPVSIADLKKATAVEREQRRLEIAQLTAAVSQAPGQEQDDDDAIRVD